jgi:hypothetical protein
VDETTPRDQHELRIGFNNAPSSFYFALGRLSPGQEMPPSRAAPGGCELFTIADGSRNIRLWNSPVNLYKEPMCRHLYYDIPLETEYVVWFDDDSFVTPMWWPALCQLFDQKIDYIGQRWWVEYLPGQVEMIRAQPWYRDIPFDSRDGKLGTWFMTGGFMAIRTERLREANFPDIDFTWKRDRLQQYGGDTLLGEIARQLGWSWAVHDKHIRVNVDLQGRHPAPRRGGVGRQFGSDIDIIIR